MEQYSNLNVHGKIKQLQNQADITDEDNQHDVVLVGTLNTQVPSALPTPTAANEGKAIISNGSGYEFGEAGKVDQVQINGTNIVASKIANVQTGTGLESDANNKIRAKLKNGDTKSSLAAATTSSTTSRQYAIEPDSSGYLSVNIPWTDHITTASDSGTGNVVTGVSANASGALTVTKGNMQTPLTAGTDYVQHKAEASKIYATNGSKADTTLAYGTSASNNYIVQRKSDGQITVPSTPTADTDAASKAFVNSSVGTNTATFRGTYNAVSDLGNTQATVDTWTDPPSSSVESTVAGQIVTKLTSLSVTPENNDYVFVSVDQTPVGDLGEDWYWRFKYSDPDNDHTGSWGYEYTLNNSSFTQAQWDAVNSGITATKVSTYDNYPTTLANKLVVGASNSATANAAVNSTTNSIFLNLTEGGSVASNSSHNIVGSGATKVASDANGKITISSTDQSVTASSNHYTPSTASGQDKTASASGATAAWSIDVVKGVTLNTDGKGHVTGISVTSGKIPANPNTDAKVQQKGITTNGEYPILLKYDTGTSDVTANYVNFAKPTSKVPTINASTGAITAAGGFIGNASTATNVAYTGITNNPFAATDVTLADM